ncbi:hypothetical protein GOODEAATRI_028042, partial [Goodea atripinnis]
ERKTAAIKKQQDHLQLVQKERAVYNEMTAACKKTCDDYQLSIGPSPPSSKKIGVHYSFDFAHKVWTDARWEELPLVILLCRSLVYNGRCNRENDLALFAQ